MKEVHYIFSHKKIGNAVLSKLLFAKFISRHSFSTVEYTVESKYINYK